MIILSSIGEAEARDLFPCSSTCMLPARLNGWCSGASGTSASNSLGDGAVGEQARVAIGVSPGLLVLADHRLDLVASTACSTWRTRASTSRASSVAGTSSATATCSEIPGDHDSPD